LVTLQQAVLDEDCVLPIEYIFGWHSCDWRNKSCVLGHNNVPTNVFDAKPNLSAHRPMKIDFDGTFHSANQLWAKLYGIA
jgi:hypothetical protein